MTVILNSLLSGLSALSLLAFFSTSSAAQTPTLADLLAQLNVDVTAQNNRLTVGLLDLAEVQVDLGQTASNLSQLSANLTSLSSRVDTHANTLSLLRRDTDGNSARIASLGSENDAQDQDIDSMRRAIAASSSQMNGAQAEMAGVRSDVASVQQENANQNDAISNLAAVSDDQAAQLDQHATMLTTQSQRMASLEANDARGSEATANMVSRLDKADTRMEAMDNRIDVANEGVAMAFALKSPAIESNKTFAISGGWGTFEGENAFAVSGAVRANDFIQLDAGIAVGSGNSSVGGRAGATVSW